MRLSGRDMKFIRGLFFIAYNPHRAYPLELPMSMSLLWAPCQLDLLRLVYFLESWFSVHLLPRRRLYDALYVERSRHLSLR